MNEEGQAFGKKKKLMLTHVNIHHYFSKRASERASKNYGFFFIGFCFVPIRKAPLVPEHNFAYMNDEEGQAFGKNR
jgi:hypothetical protein